MEQLMIEPFLKVVAQDLMNQFGNNLSGLCVVFPNKRARLFFSRYLGEAAGGKTVWAPSYRTISDLVQESSGLILADKLQLIFELFSVYKSVTGSNADFDDFYYYIEILLADFEEIDKSLVNAENLFSNLSDLKSFDGKIDYLSDNQLNAIKQFWDSCNLNRISHDQHEFLEFWSLMHKVYIALREQLRKAGLAYEGMIYRDVAEIIKASGSLRLASDKYAMVGFNALNTCEEVLFGHLKRMNIALFYWDYDTYYTNPDWHEAGYFMRENIKRYPSPSINTGFTNLTGNPKNIAILPVSSATAQAKIIPSVLNMIGLSAESDLKRTALVLADEKLLMPVLCSIPSGIKDINITMGYPLRESSAYAFIEIIYRLFRNSLSRTEGELQFHHKDVIAILKHPYIYNFNKEHADELFRFVGENNRTFLEIRDLLQYEAFSLLFRPVKSARDAVSYLLALFEHILQNMLTAGKGETDQLQLECMYQTYISMFRLSDILNSSQLTFSSRLLFNLARRICGSMTVPFTGEPLAGIQILGILETRLLDFENVVVFSMNEGTIPGSLSLTSFIPNSLRLGFGMTLPEHHDAVYAYYFYRLIQRAKNIVLVYNESNDGLMTGERSRYIQQLAFEKSFELKEIRIETTITENAVKSIVVRKEGDILRKLDAFFENDSRLWLSPSAINEFINCPLKFYFHHIMALEETEEVSEDIDPLIFGNLLHNAMHELYKPFKDRDVSQELLNEILIHDETLENILIQSFQKELFNNDKSRKSELDGMHLIIKGIIKKYILQIVRADISKVPFHIVSLEQRYTAPVKIMCQGRERYLHAGGIIDRVDSLNGFTRIIDYKTGSEKLSFRGLDALFNEIPSKRNDAAFQVFLYAWLYLRKSNDTKVLPCLLYVRNSYKADFTYYLTDQSDKTEVLSFNRYEKEFEEGLKKVLEKLFDPLVPFVQTDDEQYCILCPYKQICHR
jgi:hypothetical protein